MGGLNSDSRDWGDGQDWEGSPSPRIEYGAGSQSSPVKGEEGEAGGGPPAGLG